MARKTLREAAIDVLQQSAKQNQQPQAKQDPVGNPLAAINDLGGATWDNPQGTDIGAAAVATRTQATPPKGPAAVVDPVAKPFKANPESNLGTPTVSPPVATSTGNVVPPPADAEIADPKKDHSTGATKNVHEEAAVRRESVITKMKTLSVDEDVKAMFEGAGLTEDFMLKAKTVFESAVIARALVVVESLEKDILEASEEAVNEIKEELEGKVDSYLDHMVNEWMNKNQVAIEKGLKTEIFEEFVGGLRTLFVEHNISIPDEQVDAVEALTQQVESLKSQVNESLNKTVELQKQVNEGQKSKVLASACEGLTATQAEKLKTLAEGVDFVTADEYKGKLVIIREQYFSKQVKNATQASTVVLAESADPSSIDVKAPSADMSNLAAAVSRFARNS